jgi:hypothetical protein
MKKPTPLLIAVYIILFLVLAGGRIAFYRANHPSEPRAGKVTFDSNKVTIIPGQNDYNGNIIFDADTLPYKLSFVDINKVALGFYDDKNYRFVSNGTYEVVNSSQNKHSLILTLEESNDTIKAVLAAIPKEIIVTPNKTFTLDQ